MPTALDPVTRLLADLVQRGLTIKPTSDGHLRYRPHDRMTPDLASRLKTHKIAVIAILRAAQDTDIQYAPNGTHGSLGLSPTVYSPEEQHLLAQAHIRPGDMPLLETVKTIFPEAVVVHAHREPTPLPNPRRRAAVLIRQARQQGNHELAIALRDTWRERVAICTLDGGQPKLQAQHIAIAELEALTAAMTRSAPKLGQTGLGFMSHIHAENYFGG